MDKREEVVLSGNAFACMKSKMMLLNGFEPTTRYFGIPSAWQYLIIPFITCLGVGSGTYLRRGGVDGYDVAGIANVLLGARRIDRDEHRPI